MVRIDPTDRGSLATIEGCVRAITELAEASLLSFLEPLPVVHENGAYRVVRTARALTEAVSAASAMGASSLYTWIKLPTCPDFERVAAATTLPLVLLGGEAVGDSRPVLEDLRRGMAAGANVRGAMIGRNVLYPGADDPAPSRPRWRRSSTTAAPPTRRWPRWRRSAARTRARLRPRGCEAAGPTGHGQIRTVTARPERATGRSRDASDSRGSEAAPVRGRDAGEPPAVPGRPLDRRAGLPPAPPLARRHAWGHGARGQRPRRRGVVAGPRGATPGARHRLDEVAGKVPVVAGVYTDGTAEAVRLARDARAEGAAGILLFPADPLHVGGPGEARHGGPPRERGGGRRGPPDRRLRVPAGVRHRLRAGDARPALRDPAGGRRQGLVERHRRCSSGTCARSAPPGARSPSSRRSRCP